VPQTERFDDTHFLSLGGSTRELKPGDIVGGAYILKSLLGQGGMGYVFLAEHNIIKKDYALKIIRPDKIDDFSWQRFEIEGRVIAKLDHPNIVKIYNMGVDQGNCPFYVMDLLVGEPLSEYINRGAGLTFEQCLDIFRQVAEGLAYAHRKGIIHRDVKPANIILLEEDEEDEEDHDGGFQAKIVDFGLAKIINRSASSSQPQAITAQGQIFGSPYYMSPEQCQGQAVDHRSDIYSLGCALYESIAGEPPFVGSNAVQTLMMHTESAMPKLADRFSEQPAIAVDSLIAKMTAKEPNDRYQSMDEVAAALGRLQKRAPLFSSSAEARNSIDSAAGEDDSDITNSTLILTRGRKWLLVGSIAVVLSAALVLTYFNNLSKPDALSSSLPPEVVSLLRFGPVKSHIVSATGEREFEFPDTAIGSVTSLTNYSPQEAKGRVSFPDNSPIALAIDEHSFPILFQYPEVFAQIGTDEFNGLHLKAKGVNSHDKTASKSSSDSSFDGFGLIRRMAFSQEKLIAILKIVASWSKLSILSLDGFSCNEEVFNLIESLTQVNVLTIERSSFKMKVLAQHKFISRLKSLKIQDPRESNVDPVLSELAGSRKLEELELDSVEFGLPVFRELKHCPKLIKLTINNFDITDELIVALSQFKALRYFSSAGVKLSDSQIASLANLKNLNVTLEAGDYEGANPMRAPERLKAYRAKFPTIVFK